MMNQTLHSALFRYTNAQRHQSVWGMKLIDELRTTATITSDDSYRIFHDTLGTPLDAEIKSALDAIPILNHPSAR